MKYTILTPRFNSTRNHQTPTMKELDELRSEFYNATTLTKDILNSFTISDSMDLHDYDNCNENLQLATGTYPLVTAALSRLQVKNKGTLESTELASMKTTKTDLNSHITNCNNGLS